MAKLDLRTDETMALYHAYIARGEMQEGCRLCQKVSIAEFDFWRVVENSFPYDRIACVHHMLVSKLHDVEHNLPAEALREYIDLKTSYLNDNYDLVIEALPGCRSIPAHHHYHLIVQLEQ